MRPICLIPIRGKEYESRMYSIARIAIAGQTMNKNNVLAIMLKVHTNDKPKCSKKEVH